ncbi:hypothetical protein [Oscillibacter ruminantium]|uniref:hypothetical protein n=1 Tax=Oscillibacter ruminantium TaxID=1263547 RepID=UPI00332D15E1
MKSFFRGPRNLLCCSECGDGICRGESYWQINGAIICAMCLPDFAAAELEPFRRVRGEEREI